MGCGQRSHVVGGTHSTASSIAPSLRTDQAEIDRSMLLVGSAPCYERRSARAVTSPSTSPARAANIATNSVTPNHELTG
jgi:hypothetical protein